MILSKITKRLEELRYELDDKENLINEAIEFLKDLQEALDKCTKISDYHKACVKDAIELLEKI